ncbi:MAG: GMC family oxidoreductase [Acidobacteria bacterium]|nr:GMC family oxidoreductase [Acidobacteriota bacterium]
MAEKPYDLAIVGAGMAGCILAARIAENGLNPKTGERLRIALIDRGPYFKGAIRPGYGAPERRRMFTNIASDFGGRYVTNPGVPPGQQRRLPLRPGEEVHAHRTAAIVGGGSLLYTAITHVPYEIDYSVWVEETGVDWTYPNVKSAGDEIKRTFNLHQKPDTLLTRLDRMFKDTAKAQGFEIHDATIAKKNCLYSGYCDGVNMCRYDARMGSFTAYMPIAEKHGVEVIPGALVQRIVFEKAGARIRVQGVELTQQGVRRTLQVPRVIVSSGNFGTPQLLLRSGYGPKELVGAGLILENRNVGQNTDNRPTLEVLSGVFDEPLSDGEYHDGTTAGAYYAYYDLSPDKKYERIEIALRADEVTPPDSVAVGMLAPPFGREHKEFMRDVGNNRKMTRTRRAILSRCSADISLVRPRSVRGYVNEWGEQIYRDNDPSIVKPLSQGRELAYELLKKMGAREVIDMKKPARVRRLFTWVGSCQPGTDPSSSVVNPYFESHDIDGLFVCDASVVPRAATQGYAGTVATVAVLAATRIVERHFKKR